MIFKTKRLLIRQFEQSDIDAFYMMQSDPDVMRYIKPKLNYEQAVSELNTFISYYSDSEKFYNLWAVVELESLSFVGLCGVYQNQQNKYEIAYRLTQSSWGHGYGKEMAAALIRYSFDELKLPELVAYAASDNISSIKILKKNMRFVEEKLHEKSGLMGRKYELKSDYWLKDIF